MIRLILALSAHGGEQYGIIFSYGEQGITSQTMPSIQGPKCHISHSELEAFSRIFDVVHGKEMAVVNQGHLNKGGALTFMLQNGSSEELNLCLTLSSWVKYLASQFPCL